MLVVIWQGCLDDTLVAAFQLFRAFPFHLLPPRAQRLKLRPRRRDPPRRLGHFREYPRSYR
ncbi:MAG: hypothetical protein D6820_08895 [Lentisphaerae bacterium]|nr:MAG: hypothetical protein D6820_08895 [Lentisphaerota bacterium]